MKKLIMILVIPLLTLNIYSQEAQMIDLKVTSVNKKVSDYSDRYDLATPLDAFVSHMYILINGKDSMLGASSSERVRGRLPKSDAPDKEVSAEEKQSLLNTKVEEMLVFNDSVAGFTSLTSDNKCLIRLFSKENGKWLFAGNNPVESRDAVHAAFKNIAPQYAGYIRSIKAMNEISTDTLSFVNYLKSEGSEPKTFLLDKLANHKLVIYGELHKRKASWDLMKSVINDKSFPEKTGIVFMEMSSDSQSKIDRFYTNKTMDKEILLEVLRSVQMDGWDDRGMYEFLIDIWNINQNLPKEKIIKVVSADIPRPFNLLKTQEELFNYFDNEVKPRNEQMADIIEENIKNRTDNRGTLFIVGTGHAYKNELKENAGMSPDEKQFIFSAGSRLKKRFSDEDVYITTLHGAIMNNWGGVEGLVRKGLFDYAFEQNGNIPIAFDLKNSPFGKEHFDLAPELTYYDGIGSYENNYDGYIFLMPLKDEGPRYLLPELYTEEFVKELQRRMAIFDENKAKEITLDAMLNKLKQAENGKYWPYDFK